MIKSGFVADDAEGSKKTPAGASPTGFGGKSQMPTSDAVAAFTRQRFAITAANRMPIRREFMGIPPDGL